MSLGSVKAGVVCNGGTAVRDVAWLSIVDFRLRLFCGLLLVDDKMAPPLLLLRCLRFCASDATLDVVECDQRLTLLIPWTSPEVDAVETWSEGPAAMLCARLCSLETELRPKRSGISAASPVGLSDRTREMEAGRLMVTTLPEDNELERACCLGCWCMKAAASNGP